MEGTFYYEIRLIQFPSDDFSIDYVAHKAKAIICGPMVEAGTTAARITREIFLRRLN